MEEKFTGMPCAALWWTKELGWICIPDNREPRAYRFYADNAPAAVALAHKAYIAGEWKHPAPGEED